MTPLLIGLMVLIIVSLICFFDKSKANAILAEWAATNRLRILESEESSFGGPLFWTSSRSQTVYFVKVCDESGKVRFGWVRCGSFMRGSFSNEVFVKWKD
jgi:hypothetical protein